MKAKRTFAYLALLGLLVLVLSACTRPSTSRACRADELVAPAAPFSPVPLSTTYLSPSFSWTYPGSCEPERYSIQLSTEGDYSDASLFGTTSTSATNWGASRDLDPGTQYFWRVAAMSGTTEGPFTLSMLFNTAPICAVGSLAAPSLVSPTNGEVVNTLAPLMTYTSPNYGSCSPHQFWIDLSTDPSFSSGSPWFRTGVTAWAVAPADFLLDCTRYYWRVAEMSGSTRGPFSETWSFLTDGEESCGFVIGAVPFEPRYPVGTYLTAPVPGLLEDRIPLSASVGTFKQDANCRIGPGMSHVTMASLLQGQQVSVEGRNDDSNCLWITLPGTTIHCWVSDATINVDGLISELPIAVVLPTPTPTPTPTNTPTPILPAAPTKLVISDWVCSDSTYSVTLGWIDNAGNEDGFRVYRDAQLITTLPANATSYMENPPGSGPYTYSVEAFNAAGASMRPTVEEGGCIF